MLTGLTAVTVRPVHVHLSVGTQAVSPLTSTVGEVTAMMMMMMMMMMTTPAAAAAATTTTTTTTTVGKIVLFSLSDTLV
jgi:hypothetical protein